MEFPNAHPVHWIRHGLSLIRRFFRVSYIIVEPREVWIWYLSCLKLWGSWFEFPLNSKSVGSRTFHSGWLTARDWLLHCDRALQPACKLVPRPVRVLLRKKSRKAVSAFQMLAWVTWLNSFLLEVSNLLPSYESKLGSGTEIKKKPNRPSYRTQRTHNRGQASGDNVDVISHPTASTKCIAGTKLNTTSFIHLASNPFKPVVKC